MPAFLIPSDAEEGERLRLANRAGAFVGTGVPIFAGLPSVFAGYQCESSEEIMDCGDFRPKILRVWGEARDGWVPIEIPPEGLLLAGEPDLPSVRRAARVAALAAELDEDDDLHEAVAAKRAELRAAKAEAKEAERG